jgi:capsular polysaccharide transport system permease protein
MIDFVKRHRLWQAAAALAILFTLYWGLFAASRYMSELHVVVESLQGTAATPTDLTALLTGSSSQQKDILMLRDYLLSADLLRALDAKLKLREHYSGSYDIFSRLWSKNASAEWFLRHYRKRVEADYDEYSGLLVIRVQAYSPAMAHAIASALVQEGERFMNELAHKLAREQVAFAEREVAAVSQRLLGARQSVLAYQNEHGLVSPIATVENRSAVAARFEGELSGLHARRRALESYLAPSAPDLVQINMQVRALEQQLAADRARLASSNGKPLNLVAEEYDRLLMEAGFQQDVYKTALAALERARIDASRTLKKVSVVQEPTMPEFSLEPARLYNVATYLIATLMLTGILHLLIVIIREHRD